MNIHIMKRLRAKLTPAAQERFTHATYQGAPLGRTDKRTHDYQRHGVITLFAALNVTTGEVHQLRSPFALTRVMVDRSVSADA